MNNDLIKDFKGVMFLLLIIFSQYVAVEIKTFGFWHWFSSIVILLIIVIHLHNCEKKVSKC